MPARTLYLTERFNNAVRRLRVAGTPAGRALGAMISVMLTEDLAAARDAETLMPPVAVYPFRRVPGFNLWLYYSYNVQELFAVTLTKSPPIPLDDNRPPSPRRR